MDPNHRPEEPQQPVPAEVVYRPPPPRRRRFGPVGMLLLLFLLIVGGLVLGGALLVIAAGSFESSTKVKEKFYSHNRYGRQKIAIISVEGVILEGEGFIKRQIEHASEDEDVKAVVLRVDSPGGTITGSDFIYHHLRKLTEESEIPLVVSMGGLAASGGYYVSMAVGQTPDTIFAEPTTWTGSIGVIIPLYNASELLEDKLGIEDVSIASHPLKDMGSFTKPMTDEEREIFRGLIADSFSRFKEIIKSGRPTFQKDAAALDELATGRIFTAEQALESGLIDRIGFLEDAVDRAIELAQLDAEEVQVVRYEPELAVADLLFGSSRSQLPDPAALLDMATPRAYYLFTRLPPLVQSER